MAGMVNNLIDIMKQQIEIYEELIKTAHRKKDAIISNDVETVTVINDIDNVLVGKLSKLDKKRIELFKDIAFVLNKDQNDITITKIIEYIKGQKEEKEVEALKDRLNEILVEIRTINDKNQKLINNSLEHIEFSMNVVRTSLSKQPYYCDTRGNEIPTLNNRLFDATQ